MVRSNPAPKKLNIDKSIRGGVPIRSLPIAAGYQSSLCEVTTAANELLTVGIISEIDYDFIKIAPKNGAMRLVRTGEDVKISIHNARLGFTVLIGQVLTSARFEMKVVDIVQVVSHERRNYFRVEVEIKGYLAKEQSRLGEDNEEAFPVIVRDLSLCGMRFESAQDLSLGDVYWMQIDIDGVRFITEFRVARKQAVENMQRFAYGGEFQQGRNPDTDKLCSYLFKKQREMAKRN